ncbi:selenocysteine-specific elongation factor [Pseudomonas sp. M47T1]|uniref:selenocysteine-specific translation elongation factor n=1 Tax=Pseudomonas sp. M47T1 TaxID=1179778 RepID=UPI0002606BB1|nr:selenocysteine-specific translation elongation factor [Pseudomonas sp. M47T1]EIK95690.1 selenocysteine-specific elongation factor [Pseudomonas sp. M47T1]
MIVGTAGHIDHGKTALLAALTGQSGDRRREERERGITIDLGYQYAVLERGAPLTGFIDVPGHERFIHNMLAGAQGIDLVLLVVAADDGIMPQTREHLAIVELLGIAQVLVAITKCDRVPLARVREVQAQVGELLASGPYTAARQIAVSSVTGVGIDTLLKTLVMMQREMRRQRDTGGFRLAIDRAFSVAGAGIVVTGTALAGRVQVGDALLLGSQGQPVRVRGLHTQNQPASEAEAGERVALNLAGERLDLAHIHRGDWLVPAWLFAPTRRIDIQLRLLAGETRAFEHFSPVHVHLGTQDVTARVALLEGSRLEPGGYMLAQLLLNAPVQAVRGDPLVLRDHSAQRTLGGGRVLDPFAPSRQRRNPARLAQLHVLNTTRSLEAALPLLLTNNGTGLDPQRLERQFNRLRDTWRLPAGVRVMATRQGPLLFNEQRWQSLKGALLAHLERFHELEADQMGPDRDRLRRFAALPLERPAFISLLDELLAEQAIVATGPWLHLAGHRPQLSPADQALWQRIRPLLALGGFDPPWVRDLASATGHDDASVRMLMRKLARLGQVHQVVKDLFYPDNTLQQMAAMLRQLSAAAPDIQVSDFRDRLALGRKRSIQVLEFFDRIGLTRRLGEHRRLRPDNPLAQEQ